jgi:hypothetical protein
MFNQRRISQLALHLAEEVDGADWYDAMAALVIATQATAARGRIDQVDVVRFLSSLVETDPNFGTHFRASIEDVAKAFYPEAAETAGSECRPVDAGDLTGREVLSGERAPAGPVGDGGNLPTDSADAQ